MHFWRWHFKKENDHNYSAHNNLANFPVVTLEPKTHITKQHTITDAERDQNDSSLLCILHPKDMQEAVAWWAVAV